MQARKGVNRKPTTVASHATVLHARVAPDTTCFGLWASYLRAWKCVIIIFRAVIVIVASTCNSFWRSTFSKTHTSWSSEWSSRRAPKSVSVTLWTGWPCHQGSTHSDNVLIYERVLARVFCDDEGVALGRSSGTWLCTRTSVISGLKSWPRQFVRRRIFGDLHLSWSWYLCDFTMRGLQRTRVCLSDLLDLCIMKFSMGHNSVQSVLPPDARKTHINC